MGLVASTSPRLTFPTIQENSSAISLLPSFIEVCGRKIDQTQTVLDCSNTFVFSSIIVVHPALDPTCWSSPHNPDFGKEKLKTIGTNQAKAFMPQKFESCSLAKQNSESHIKLDQYLMVACHNLSLLRHADQLEIQLNHMTDVYTKLEALQKECAVARSARH